jgi:hypothetical protein
VWEKKTMNPEPCPGVGWCTGVGAGSLKP